ncbi:MAG TPA: anaerobic nitric oxide reductase flavorubredoxin, partial [Spirochaetales bacterium]|nr:anaerobic nitric oxide reductase flavorubredoxin [Spirochaetales bacterium]
IKEVDPTLLIKLFNSARSDMNDIITEIFKSKLIIVGSPTINKGILHSVAAIIEMIKGLSFKNKKAVGFGTYGWSGESVKIINEELKEAGFEVLNEGIKALWYPDENSLQECIDFGKDISEGLNKN